MKTKIEGEDRGIMRGFRSVTVVNPRNQSDFGEGSDFR